MFCTASFTYINSQAAIGTAIAAANVNVTNITAAAAPVGLHTAIGKTVAVANVNIINIATSVDIVHWTEAASNVITANIITAAAVIIC